MKTAYREVDIFADAGGYESFIAGDINGPVPYESRLYSVIKRMIDIAGALLGLILILPLLPFLILMIKVDSPGPVLFKQERVGYRGRIFPCYKFRSMERGAEARKSELSHMNEATGAAFKIQDDPRITGVGRYIRSSSLDEFPQLFNVLKGDMSIVGPRPQIPSEVAEYTSAQARRLLVRPGLTCLWQVSGRSQLDFTEWMALDLAYVRQRSLRFDLWVLSRTIPAVIERKGAY
ncbi:MAG: sugar transferase [Thermoanaerobaculales bacterium]|nr:sugar transferase [Thermoanaerobaculales bacterium]